MARRGGARIRQRVVQPLLDRPLPLPLAERLEDAAAARAERQAAAGSQPGAASDVDQSSTALRTRSAYAVQSVFALAPVPMPLAAGAAGHVQTAPERAASVLPVTASAVHNGSSSGGSGSSSGGSGGLAHAPAVSPAACHVAADPAASPLAFTRHLVAAANGGAPLPCRMESLAWLLFSTGREQARLLGGTPPDAPSVWLASPEAAELLERVYAVGEAAAELGVADGLAPPGGGAGVASNGQRAIASLDFAGLLTRYLQQARRGAVGPMPCRGMAGRQPRSTGCRAGCHECGGTTQRRFGPQTKPASRLCSWLLLQAGHALNTHHARCSPVPTPSHLSPPARRDAAGAVHRCAAR